MGCEMIIIGCGCGCSSSYIFCDRDPDAGIQRKIETGDSKVGARHRYCT